MSDSEKFQKGGRYKWKGLEFIADDIEDRQGTDWAWVVSTVWAPRYQCEYLPPPDKRFQAAVVAMREDIARGNVAHPVKAQERAPYWVACADALLATLAEGGEK